MVQEAQNKVIQMILQAVQSVAQLAILKGSRLCLLENSSKSSSARVMYTVSSEGLLWEH